VPLITEYDALRFIFALYKLEARKAAERPAYIKEHFAEVSANLGYKALPPEGLVERLGRQSLPRDTVKAIEYYQINADLFPGSPKGYPALIAKLRAAKTP
jgi:hypothetical protein